MSEDKKNNAMADDLDNQTEGRISEYQKKKVAVISNKYGIVVKGIERKLIDGGYKVTVLMDDRKEIEANADKHALFLIYLPKDIMEKELEINQLSSTCYTINGHGRSIILVGEKKNRADLVNKLPKLANFPWIDQPVKMDDLMELVDKTIRAETMHAGKKRILIVDDDPGYAKMAREWIKDEYRVDIVTAGMQAITFLLKNQVDLILLDYEMPVVDGPQVLQMLRQEPATEGIPVVFLTGIDSRESVDRVMELRPKGYILKSTTKEKLLGYLKDYFD